MRLLIVSNMSHYQGRDAVVGWGPTVREIDELAKLFEEVVHVGCIHEESPPPSSLPYSAPNVKLLLVPAAGGYGLKAKVGVLFRYPGWASVIRRALRRADAVHVRGPANVSLLALFILLTTKAPNPRWIKYAGNWRPTYGEPLTYRFQRWLLRRPGHGAVVTVNGDWSGQPSHIVALDNPCLSQAEIEDGRQASIRKVLGSPVCLVHIGALIEGKGAATAIRTLRYLSLEKSGFILDIVGDGPLRPDLERLANELGVSDLARFHGFIPRDRIPGILRSAHFTVHPSRSEGFPKVIAEGMAFGSVPIAGAVSGIAKFLNDSGAGTAVSPIDARGFADAILRYVDDKDSWSQAVTCCLQASRSFSYDAYLNDVTELLRSRFGVSLERVESRAAIIQ